MNVSALSAPTLKSDTADSVPAMAVLPVKAVTTSLPLLTFTSPLTASELDNTVFPVTASEFCSVVAPVTPGACSTGWSPQR